MQPPADKSDWRIENARRTRGATVRRTQYHAKSANGEHEHCEACLAKFMGTVLRTRWKRDMWQALATAGFVLNASTNFAKPWRGRLSRP